MKVYRIYAGPTGHETQIAQFFLTDGGTNIYCEITEPDMHGMPDSEWLVPLALAGNQHLVIVSKNAELSARWME